MDLLQHMTERARSLQRSVVLAEGTEPRTLRAANRVLSEGLAQVILIGDAAEIKALAASEGLESIGAAKIVDPKDPAIIDRYAPILLELRKSKGMTEEQSRKTAADPLYLGCLMVKAGDAYCMVAGAENTTGDVLRAAFQVIKTRPGIDVVSGAFIMIMPEGVDYGTNGVMIMGDCAVVPNPDARQLAQIAVSSAETARNIAGIEPRVAMLSYSTKGSGKGEDVDKVVEATRIAHEMAPELNIDGELQADAALVPVVAAKKAPDSNVAGQANVLVFPSLEVGNIAYKLVQRIAGAQAVGPVLQGLAAPVNDLSRGASWEDIYKTIIMTCNQ
ncbi:MAG: phosphate acetyltransferase [Muribaculaceae bacterium]|nr:phosphate acetyltransferase [Muribaculaceae bacterium]MDE7334808.1 phosphate acetyltransferase [Muribaculaceae bacterium]